MDDYERFTEKEVLEIIKSEQKKVWDTCILFSLIYEGNISNLKLLHEYPYIRHFLCANLGDKFEKFKRDRREWARKFRA